MEPVSSELIANDTAPRAPSVQYLRMASAPVRFGHHANSWGGVVGHPVGVTSIKDLFYLTPGDTLATLAEVADAGYDGIELFDGNLAEFAEDLWRVTRACGWAAELGAEHLDDVARVAESHGLVASFHPHLSTIVESPEQIQRLFDRTPIRFCPDTGHLQAAGGDPVELVRTYRERIDYVHLKDLDASGGFVPLGQGVLDVGGVLQVLRETDFDGWITVETDGWDGDPGAGARASRARLAQLAGEEH